jgi:hypothetical protein
METAFSVESDPRLYNEDPRLAESELAKPLETTVEDDGDGNEFSWDLKSQPVKKRLSLWF